MRKKKAKLVKTHRKCKSFGPNDITKGIPLEEHPKQSRGVMSSGYSSESTTYLKRFIEKFVDQKWDVAYSEICSKQPKGARPIDKILSWVVALKVEMVDGVPTNTVGRNAYEQLKKYGILPEE